MALCQQSAVPEVVLGVDMDNDASTVEVIFGVLRASAAVVPLNTSVSNELLDAMLSDAGIWAVFASKALYARFSQTGLAKDVLKIVNDSGPPPHVR